MYMYMYMCGHWVYVQRVCMHLFYFNIKFGGLEHAKHRLFSFLSLSSLSLSLSLSSLVRLFFHNTLYGTCTFNLFIRDV